MAVGALQGSKCQRILGKTKQLTVWSVKHCLTAQVCVYVCVSRTQNTSSDRFKKEKDCCTSNSPNVYSDLSAEWNFAITYNGAIYILRDW